MRCDDKQSLCDGLRGNPVVSPDSSPAPGCSEKRSILEKMGKNGANSRLPWCAPKHSRRARDSSRARLVLSAASRLNPCQPTDSRRPQPIAAKNCLPVGAVLVFQPTIDVFPTGIVVRPMYNSTFTMPFILTVKNYYAAFL